MVNFQNHITMLQPLMLSHKQWKRAKWSQSQGDLVYVRLISRLADTADVRDTSRQVMWLLRWDCLDCEVKSKFQGVKKGCWWMTWLAPQLLNMCITSVHMEICIYGFIDVYIYIFTDLHIYVLLVSFLSISFSIDFFVDGTLGGMGLRSSTVDSHSRFA